MTEHVRTYTVILQPTAGGWQGRCLELPECTGSGKGRQVAYRAVKAAIRAYLHHCLLHGYALPRRQVVVKRPRFDLRKLDSSEVEALR